MGNTFVWMLRFALFELLAGFVALAVGGYLALTLQAPDPNAAFVPVVAMFGIWPYLVLALIGAVLIIVAWRKGSAWKNGK